MWSTSSPGVMATNFNEPLARLPCLFFGKFPHTEHLFPIPPVEIKVPRSMSRQLPHGPCSDLILPVIAIDPFHDRISSVPKRSLLLLCHHCGQPRTAASLSF